jgi:hypothetical protein
MSTKQQKESAYLRRCLQDEASAAARDLAGQIAQLQCKENCLSRARRLVAVLMALALAGLGYAAVLQDSFSDHAIVFTNQFAVNTISALCLGFLISLLGFACLGLVYRRQLSRLLEEGRQLINRLPESRTGEPHLPNPIGHGEEQKVVPLRSARSEPALPDGTLSRTTGSV